MKLVLRQPDGDPTWVEFDQLNGDIVVMEKEELTKFLDKIHLTMTAMMPGIRNLAFGPIKELNEALVELDQARHFLKK